MCLFIACVSLSLSLYNMRDTLTQYILYIHFSTRTDFSNNTPPIVSHIYNAHIQATALLINVAVKIVVSAVALSY